MCSLLAVQRDPLSTCTCSEQWLGVTGDPDIMRVILEAKRTARLLDLELVRQEPKTMQALDEKYDSLCAYLTQVTSEGASTLPEVQSSNLALCIGRRSKALKCISRRPSLHKEGDFAAALILTKGTGDVNASVSPAGGVQVVPHMNIRPARKLRPSATDAEVLGGEALLAQIAQCSQALSQPFAEQDEDDVDLSPATPPSKQGELLSSASLYLRAHLGAHGLASLLPEYAQSAEPTP